MSWGRVDIAAQTFTGGVTPQPFSITDPPDYGTTGTQVSVAQGLTVTWTPQLDAFMEIFIVGGMMGPLTSCLVQDTGSLTIPAEAVTGFYGPTTIQLRRQVVRYQKITANDGNAAHIYLIGRHARLRQFYVTM